MLEEPPSAKLQATSEAARAMLEEQNEFLLRDLKSVEESYGTDALTLTVSRGYLERLLSNPKIERYMERYHFDILVTLQEAFVRYKPDPIGCRKKSELNWGSASICSFHEMQ